ncbi:MAG: 4-(cytidine 5'-diphospho)-2-C-methyl-D-erythritol kinase [Gemmatimonadaceae bacterium]|nr:4-(cytidine 5'-diphospho)-2-C-methyl-D-erythritol kinase [Gemmatimonadaceae bacterium]
MRSATLVAQAKVNLFLRVLAREAGGYHQIETLFCRLTLGDEVRVRLTNGQRSLDCAGIAMPRGGLGATEHNLAWRAALAFLDATRWTTGFAIEIDKRIPVGGGLGGGSADAGGVLRALNALAPSPLSAHELLRLGTALGADVPFLTQEASPLALAWGRGDRLLPLPPLPARACLLFAFSSGVATADAYRWLAEEPAPPAGSVAYRVDQLSRWEDVELMAYNEFERVVLPRHAIIRRVVEGLRHPQMRGVVPVALMSGSGATVFALLARPSDAELAEDAQGQLVVAIGDEPTDEGVDEVMVLETETAAHVEPVRLAD